jgi:hypothetical protein
LHVISVGLLASAFLPQILRSAKLEEIRLTILNNLLAFHPESGEQLAWGNAARAGAPRRRPARVAGSAFIACHVAAAGPLSAGSWPQQAKEG